MLLLADFPTQAASGLKHLEIYEVCASSVKLSHNVHTQKVTGTMRMSSQVFSKTSSDKRAKKWRLVTLSWTIHIKQRNIIILSRDLQTQAASCFKHLEITASYLNRFFSFLQPLHFQHYFYNSCIFNTTSLVNTDIVQAKKARCL